MTALAPAIAFTPAVLLVFAALECAARREHRKRLARMQSVFRLAHRA